MPTRRLAGLLSVLVGFAVGANAFAAGEGVTIRELTAPAAPKTETERTIYREAPPKARLDVGYSLSMRDNHQLFQRASVDSNGYAPDHLALSGAYFFANSVGAQLDFSFSRFKLVGSDMLGRSMESVANELAVAAGPLFRWVGSSVSAEGMLAYGFGQVPSFNVNPEGLTFAKLSHHGPMLAANIGWSPVKAFGLQLKGRYTPMAVGGISELNLDKFQQLTAGADVLFGSFDTGTMRWNGLLDYEFTYTKATGPEERDLWHRVHQVGLGLRAQLTNPEPIRVVLPPPTGPGKLRGQVLLAHNKQPAAGFTVEVAGAKPVTTDATGAFLVDEVGPGPVAIRVSGEGYRPSQGSVNVSPEAEARVEVDVIRIPTGPGWITGVVLLNDPKAPDGKRPIANVPVLCAGQTVNTAEDGSFRIEKAGPGPVAVTIKAKGYKPAEEIVSVPPEAGAQVELKIVKEGVTLLATLKGLVRSAKGAPLAAKLRIPEANISTTTEKDGRFQLRVPGGRYTVIIESDGYIEQTKSVEVADGDQAIFNVDMQRHK